MGNRHKPIEITGQRQSDKPGFFL